LVVCRHAGASGNCNRRSSTGFPRAPGEAPDLGHFAA
jgi:hypothetical protein